MDPGLPRPAPARRMSLIQPGIRFGVSQARPVSEPITVYAVNYPLAWFRRDRLAAEHVDVALPVPAAVDPGDLVTRAPRPLRISSGQI